MRDRRPEQNRYKSITFPKQCGSIKAHILSVITNRSRTIQSSRKRKLESQSN